MSRASRELCSPRDHHGIGGSWQQTDTQGCRSNDNKWEREIGRDPRADGRRESRNPLALGGLLCGDLEELSLQVKDVGKDRALRAERMVLSHPGNQQPL